MNKLTRLVAVVLVLALTVGVFLFLRKYTDGFKTDFATFFVSVDGKDVLRSSSDNGFNGEMTFDVKYTFGALQGEDKAGFDYKLTPVTDFVYSVGDEEYRFSDVDLDKALNVQKTDSSLTVSFPSSIYKLLAEYHNVTTAEIDCDIIEGDTINLTFTSEDGRSSVSVAGHFADVWSIEISTEGIVF